MPTYLGSPFAVSGFLARSVPSLKMAKPVYSFDNPMDFYRIHKAGTETDHRLESQEIERFNKKKIPFRSWIAYKTDSYSSAKQQWIFLISPGADADKSFPRVGESCKVKLITRGKEDKTDWLQAERVENDGKHPTYDASFPCR